MSVLKKPPVAGVDYPTAWGQFLDWFHSEDACREYLEKLKWEDGFFCKQCKCVTSAKPTSRNRWVCNNCKYQTTVTAGTLFDKTRTELRVWFAALWYVTSQKHGVSALGLQRVLGLGSYETAWTMLHRLRRAMVNPHRSKLNGRVEVDESYLSIKDIADENQTFKSSTEKVLVGIAIEIKEPKQFGRIRVQRLINSKADCLENFICTSIEPNSQIHTDGSFSYRKLSDMGYQHFRTVHSGSQIPAHESMPGVHRVASLLQRWTLGTHHGAIKPKQLDFYLDEFVFRFNRRTSTSRGLLFYRLIRQAVSSIPVTYKDIVSKPEKHIQVLRGYPL